MIRSLVASLPLPFVSPLCVFVVFSSTQSSTSTLRSNYLHATILYWTWFARNRATFHNSVLSSDNIVQLVMKDIQVRIRCEKLDSVGDFWSFNNVLCSLDDNDNIVFPHV